MVGGTLVLEKPFRLMCHSEKGTLPIVYTLYGPNRLLAKKRVTTAEERAVFNVSAIDASGRIKDFHCNASNSVRRKEETGQVLRSTKIIGASHAAAAVARKKTKTKRKKSRPAWRVRFLFDCLFVFAEPVSTPTLHIRPTTGDVAEGQEMTLVCSVQGGSLPVSFTWYRSGEPEDLASVTVNKLEASHKISEVRGDHQGAYYCVCTNTAEKAKQSPTVSIAGGFCFTVVLNDGSLR